MEERTEVSAVIDARESERSLVIQQDSSLKCVDLYQFNLPKPPS
jgi:hypothetical protein